MTQPFRDAPLDIEGTTTAITLNNLLRHEVNVATFANLHEGAGTFGSGSGNDSPCFQAAVNAAFKTAGQWNGLTNAYLNRPIRVPNGKYICTDQIDLVKVCGGSFIGSGVGSTYFHGGTQDAIFNLNGCSWLTFQDFSMEGHGSMGDGSCLFRVDWDGDNSGNGCDGNHHNHFKNMNTGSSGQYGFVIGSDATSQGHGTRFTQVNVNGGYTVIEGEVVSHCTGIYVQGPNATVFSTGGGGVHQHFFIHCPVGGGSAWAQGWSTGNYPAASPSADFCMESGGVMNIGQGRSESQRLALIENGNVSITDVTTTGAYPVVTINGGLVTIENTHFGGIAGTHKIVGTGGQLILAGLWIDRPAPNLNYSGTILYNLPVIT